MYDASGLVKKFHDSHVALSRAQSQDMQKRRDANLDRVTSGLEELKKPSVAEVINQGGNAMQTMTQPPEGDEDTRYDIDVGVVFEKDSAKTPVTTKTWVRDAIAAKGKNFKTEPVVKKKCVRVVYNDGYQVDLPVLRRSLSSGAYIYEIAMGDEWVSSDPKAINKWFDDRVEKLSPGGNGGYQLRRVVRLVKYFSKVRAARTGLKFPAGLVATALAVECYQPAKDRDDEAFYLTLKRIQDRSEYSPIVANGTVISDDKDIERLKRLGDAAHDAVSSLGLLAADDSEMTDEKARKAWKRVFSHSFFDSETAQKSIRESQLMATPGVVLGLSPEERLSRARAKADEVSDETRPWRGEF